jgi:hypothetical protein
VSHIEDFAVISKDRAVSKILALAVAPMIGRYGKLISLRLDTSSRIIDLEILLKGETLPISVRMIDYGMITEGERHFVTCGKVSVSREWMKILAEELLQDKVFELPSKYSKFFNLLT